MKSALAKMLLASTAGVMMTGAALAQATTATATAELNIRSGPGPQYPAIGAIANGGTATVLGCADQSLWCEVDYNGTTGWAYSDYLTIDSQGIVVTLSERPAELVGVVPYDVTADPTVTGAAGGAIVGALIGGPVGAAIGGALGATTGVIIDPPQAARGYIEANPVEPIYLDGEVVVGAQVPDTVIVTPVPDYEYAYVNVNGQMVLVDPGTRAIVHVFR